MAIATGSQSDLGYMLETTYGVLPATGTRYKGIRRKSAAGLNLTKDSYDSEEVRLDRQLADSRHGVRRAGGDVETELSAGSYSDLLIGLLGHAAISNTTPPIEQGWTEVSTLDIAAGPSVNFSATNSTITVSGGQTTYFIGDSFTITGANAANNLSYTVANRSGASLGVMEVFPAPGLTEVGLTVVTFSGNSVYSARTGRVYNSFTLERAFTDIDQYQYFTGMRVNSLALSLPATGLATATWNFLGKNASPLSNAPASTIEPTATGAYSTVSLNSVLAAVNGVIYFGVIASAVVTDLSFTIDNQLGGAEVVGSNVIPESLWGNTQMITGKATVLFENDIHYNRFDNETDATLYFRMTGSDGSFLSFSFPRVKFNSASIGDAVATGLPLEMEFRALLPTSIYEAPSQVIVHTSHISL